MRSKRLCAYMRREILRNEGKKALDAARAVWYSGFGHHLSEVMTPDQCDEAVRVGCNERSK